MRGLNPSSVTWEHREGDRNIDRDDTFFIHGAPSKQEDCVGGCVRMLLWVGGPSPEGSDGVDGGVREGLKSTDP